MPKVSKSKPAIAADPAAAAGWNGNRDHAPQAEVCRDCGAPVPVTLKRSDDAFAGHGRRREYCNDVCRQRWSRRQRARRNAELVSQKRVRGDRG